MLYISWHWYLLVEEKKQQLKKSSRTMSIALPYQRTECSKRKKKTTKKHRGIYVLKSLYLHFYQDINGYKDCHKTITL